MIHFIPVDEKAREETEVNKVQDDEERREFYSKIAETLPTERYIEFESCRSLKLIGKQNKHSSLFAQWCGVGEQMRVE